MLVYTKNGLIDKDQLAVRHVQEWTDNALTMAVEWYLGEELVRRDAWVNILRPLESLPEMGKVA